ncbi:phage tail protein [Sphingopyxis indica]|uniref:GTA baseplate fiber-binding domain-containing protein n=1 Tax=Sphingopyxis indica TaxID=436663 RepID=UPI0029393110|nr:phage tail protein [Sphingopyxis indica]WOF43700.1 phage tail protein [Sphingopyxis indica]
MATLVLTVVGGIVGGPVGAALGAAIGRQADAAIFAPKGREGPRLADLKVQASTYGQQIPQLFGTMRVAGSVIWATDLIERRAKSGGGKGRPSVTEYSYAVSMAVALSSRRVRAIRRIWADGNLLRSASGTFKERCTFRWYDGSEDQAVDPLIASAVGSGSASAFRGTAYALFEELDLASFGNRIPSLTFEVEADAGDIDAGLIGDTLLGEAGRCAGQWPLSGYAASGDRARDALAPLFEVDAARLVSRSDGWQIAPASLAGDMVALADFREARGGEAASDRVEQRRAPLSALPGLIRLRHYEPGRDYQLGQQSHAVAGGGAREERIDLPAALPAAAARGLARRLAAAAADGRETCVWQADLAAMALPVGGRIALADASVWRLARRTVKASGVTIELLRHQPLADAGVPADPGVPVSAPDWPDATGVVRLFDLPSIGASAATAARIAVAGAGSNDGWRGADCWFVPAAEAEPVALGSLRPAAAMGVLAAALAPGSPDLVDEAHVVIVELDNASMAFESVSHAQLLGGANRAMIGGELIQFQLAEPLSPTLWRLSRLLRGRAGTACDSEHAAGAPFLSLDDAGALMLPEDLAGWAASGAARVQWAERNDVALTELAVPSGGQAVRPLSPVHPRVSGDGEGGLIVEWTRRSRLDTGWRDEVDLPPGESRERYRVALDPAVPGLGPWECDRPLLHLDAAMAAGLAGGVAMEIRQVGDLALSDPLTVALG